MIDAQLRLRAGTSERTVSLASYLDPAAEESARAAEYGWIKGLRALPVDGDTFRDRFTVRGDSLWWFSEIYLHKQQTILNIHRVLAALGTLFERERPQELTVLSAPPDVHYVIGVAAAARSVRGHNTVEPDVWRGRLRALLTRARRLTWTAHLSPERLKRVGRRREAPQVAAFIHRAFWRRGGGQGEAETYIGPVLAALEDRLGSSGIRYVGVGPTENFRAGRSWRARASLGPAVIPIERYAAMGSLAASRSVWQDRKKNFRAIAASRAIRDAAVIEGIDCWPIVQELIAGITWLQWPWSARAMDESAAALDHLEPGAVVTYAEAGGWGRALILESRRRGIPSAGLQHGFIYRHWLNYRHESDEMADSRTGAFPAPTRTLLFDAFAANHLRTAGRFDDASLAVTGSPRLDELAATLGALAPDAAESIRRHLGVSSDEQILLLVTKEREARSWLPALYEAAASVPRAVLVIKPHPAETADAYVSASGHDRIRVLSPAEPLAPLLACARCVVTVNSTVALDAAVLDIPGLAMGLPNNLSPFVDAGAMAGAATPAELSDQLHRIVYDDEFRQRLSAGRREMLGRHAIAADGRSAVRCADSILELVRQRRDS